MLTPRARDIWIVQAAGGPAVNLTRDHPGADRDPAWSPEGGQIAFVSQRDGGGVYVMPAIGGSPTRISSTGEPAFFSSPQWSAEWLGGRLSAAPERYELLAC